MAVSEHLPRESTGVLLRSFISTAFDPRRISLDNRDYDNEASHFKCDSINDPQNAGKVCVRNVRERACRDARADHLIVSVRQYFVACRQEHSIDR